MRVVIFRLMHRLGVIKVPTEYRESEAWKVALYKKVYKDTDTAHFSNSSSKITVLPHLNPKVEHSECTHHKLV